MSIMPRPQSIFATLIALLASAAITGCTMYTEPPRVGFSGQVRGGAPGARFMGAPGQPASYGSFYEALSPYGEWYDTRACGQDLGPVWRPHPGRVGRNFTPYVTGGQWVATDQGWSFASDFEWGWAAFHYGRWCPDARFGWVWAPGDEWAPSWVDWRYGGGYVGWAPLPPRGVRLPRDRYVYADRTAFAGTRITPHSLPRQRAIEAQRVTRPHQRTVQHSGYSWSAGPPVNEVRRPDGREIRPVHVAPPPKGNVRRVIVRPRH